MSGREATTTVIPGAFAIAVGDAAMPSPPKWCWTELTAIARLESGHTPSREHPEYWDGDIHWIGIRDARVHHGREIHSTFQTVTQAGLDHSAARLLPARTVCLSRTASVGYVVVMGKAMATSQDFVNWVCGPVLEPNFLKYLLIAEKDSLLSFGKGSTHTTIYYPEVKALQIPLPPLPEQHRIVAKLDSLLAKSRRAREALDAIPPLLEQLRQSLLASAFRGDLTADWRAKNPEVEPATELLKRIRVERRKKWEEAELAKMKAKGKTPTDDKWKAKYVEPEPVDDSELPELPKGWCWVPLPSLGELARGKSKHRPRNDPALFGAEKPFIQTGDVARANGRIVTWSTMYSTMGVAQSRIFPEGTICITIAGNIAESAVLSFEACFPDSVVGLIPVRGMIPSSYVEFFMRVARSDLQRFAPATAQANINLEILNDVAIPLPPEEEMHLISTKLDAIFKRIDAVADECDQFQQEATTLERAALAKAFRGELVPQDPNDEPASVMLERLRAEREKDGTIAKKRGKGAAKVGTEDDQKELPGVAVPTVSSKRGRKAKAKS